MGIRQAVRLNPPAPPKSGRHDPHNVLLASSGFSSGWTWTDSPDSSTASRR